MSSDFAIELSGIGKCYQIYAKPSDRLKHMLFGRYRTYHKEFWAVRGIDLRVRRGETLGIIGKNGSGKSTLLQLICGTLNPSEGSVNVRGRVAALLELGAGFNPEFTGVENIYMAASLYGLSRQAISERFDAIAEFAEIGEHINQPVKTYSSGMYVRLAFAVIANVDADVLIIDEALAVGDVFFVQKCMRFLRNFARTGTLLFVSHDTSAVLSLCNRAVLLNFGSIQRQGEPKEVSEYYLALQQTGAITRQIDIGVPTEESARPKRESNDFGAGGAYIDTVVLRDERGGCLELFEGGESAFLEIIVRCEAAVERPIVGFFVKNRFGQAIFGANSSEMKLGGMASLGSGDIVRVCFGFEMPCLANGAYSVTVAISNGTLAEHVQLDWIHDALAFSISQRKNRNAILEVPMRAFEASILDRQGAASQLSPS